MLGCCSFFQPFSEPLKDALLLYKRVTEQYKNEDILTVVRSLIPHNVILQTKKDGNIISLLKWFKNDFMKWTKKLLFVKSALMPSAVTIVAVTATGQYHHQCKLK